MEAYKRIQEVNSERNHISNYRRTLEIIDDLKEKNAEEYLYYYIDNDYDIRQTSKNLEEIYFNL